MTQQEKPPNASDERVFGFIPAQALLKALPVPIYVTDAQGRVVYFNAAAVRFAGREPALGELWSVTWRLFDADGSPLAPEHSPMAIALHEGRVVRDVESIAERPDGSRVSFMPYPTPLFDEQGELVGGINALIDLTDQKRSEAALAQSLALREQRVRAQSFEGGVAMHGLSRPERDFQLLVRSVTDYAIFMLDAEGYITSWNIGAEKIKGYSEAEILGQHFSRFYTTEDRADGIPQLALARALHDGRYEAEGWRVRKDGTRFWANVVIDPVWDQDNLVGFAKVTRDATTRRAAEVALMESERRARGILDTALDAFVQVDEAGLITEWNPQAHALFGWSREAAVGKSLAWLCFSPDDVDTHDWFVTALHGDLRHPTHQVVVIDRSHQQFPVELSVSALALASGRLMNIFIRDVTEKLQMETQLRQAQKMEAMGQLTGGIAHDFNNILQGISGSLEVISMLAARGQQERSEKHIRNALESVKRAASLTHRLLAFARRQSLDPQPVDVTNLLGGMTELLRHTLGEQIALELVLSSDLWEARCDPNQLENALLNLAINARDAMPGGGRLRIEANNALDRDPESPSLDAVDQPYVKVAITDTGIGMSEEVRQRAFDPFYTTKAAGEGTGLGLSMVYGFARQSRGYCTIESEQGIGTCVELYLPRYVGEKQRAPVPVRASKPHFVQGEHILVVEDEAVIRNVITEVLSNLGYEITQAVDGLEGVSIAVSDYPIDLIITDIGLPGVNGRSVAEAARDRRPGLPVLLITGYDASADSAPLDLPAGTALLSKPFTVDKLREQVSRLLEWRRENAAAPADDETLQLNGAEPDASIQRS
ncbi:PAS domain S-box protein [Dyella acidiphila]|uniref:histidine kinase n=1 Tax=Dyella acidiphila TaxID=2775866 RepID=A0ABR9GCS4_9GAMM|nr:PAS domain S-box protein [Dyella acidiphila]